MTTPEEDDLIRRIEEAKAAYEAWPDKDRDLFPRVPEEGLCGLCWGRGVDSPNKHYLLYMCPGPPPVVNLMALGWNADDQELKKENVYTIDHTAIPETIAGLVQILYGMRPGSQ